MTESPKKKLLKAIRTLVGFAVAAMMVRFVVSRSGVSLADFEKVSPPMVVLAFCSFGVGIVLAAYRWKILLNYVKVPLSYPAVLRLTFIGLFFNLFVPGGVGGDLIKMFYLRREAGDNFAEAVLTVLLDRLLGLGGLLALAVVGLFLNQELLFSGTREMKGMLFAVGLASAAGLLGALLFFAWPLLGGLGRRLATLMERFPEKLRGILERVAEALNLLRKVPVRLVQLFLLAMFGHLCATVGVMFIGWGLESALSFGNYLLCTQLANLVGAVPLTPGGVGGRDLAMLFLLNACGAEEAVQGVLPLMMTAILISWSAIGGLALLWERKTGVVAEEVAQV